MLQSGSSDDGRWQLITTDAIREMWRRKGVPGHCPVCHRHDWEEQGEVALPNADGGDAVRAGALRCGNCNNVLLVAPS